MDSFQSHGLVAIWYASSPSFWPTGNATQKRIQPFHSPLIEEGCICTALVFDITCVLAGVSLKLGVSWCLSGVMLRWLFIRQVEALWVRLRSPTNRSLLLSFILSNVATVYIYVSATVWEIAIALWSFCCNATLPHPIAATVDIAAPPQRTLRNWKTLNTWNWLPEWNLTSTQHRQSTGMEGGKYLNWATCGTWAETHLKTWEKLRQNRKLHRFRRSFWTIPRVKLYTWLVVWEGIILPRWSLEYCSPWEGAW